MGSVMHSRDPQYGQDAAPPPPPLLPGMKNEDDVPNTYWIMTETLATWDDLDIICGVEKGRLVVIESRRENDCIVKYIMDEYKGDPVKSFAIGLKTPQNYKGVYEWKHVDNSDPNFDAATPTIENWAPTSPTGAYCTVMDIGSAAPISGLWKDVDCITTKFYGICEKVKPKSP